MPPAIRIDGLVAVKRASILQELTREVLFRGFATPRATPAEIVRPADACLTALVRVLGPGSLGEAERARVAHDYAEQRVRLGYDLRALLVEFGVLRSLVLGALAGVPLPSDTAARIADFLHEIMVDAALHFAGRASGARAPALGPARSSKDHAARVSSTYASGRIK